MGWLTYAKTKEDLIQDLKIKNPTIKEWSLVGNHLWGLYPAVSNVKDDSYEFNHGDLLIHVFILAKIDNEWGYKCLSESSHPYYYTCPLKFLKKGKVLNLEWRKAVKEYHENKRKKANFKVEIGQVIDLVNCNLKSVKIVNLQPLRGIDQSTGKLYRIPKKFLAI